MTDLAGLSERDILIRLDSKFDMIEGRVATLEEHVSRLDTNASFAAGSAASKASMGEMLLRAPSILWTALAIGAILYAWLH
jgi:hypothetical protein